MAGFRYETIVYSDKDIPQGKTEPEVVVDWLNAQASRGHEFYKFYDTLDGNRILIFRSEV